MRPAGHWSFLDAGWRWGSVVADLALAESGGPTVIERLQRDRFRRLVTHARAHSPFYAERYRDIPPRLPHLADLPPVRKRDLMARFDDWSTDREVTRERVEAFAREPRWIGRPFLDRYALFSSSGTTGVPGLFLHDADALAVYDALGTARMGALAPLWDWRTPPGGHRFALVAATGGHFAGVTMWERLRALHPWFGRHAIVVPVTDSLDAIARSLEAFRPTVLASYATVLRALAERKLEGRLACDPHTVWHGGEWMAPEARATIVEAFGARVAGDYGASEFLNIAFECEHGALHVNADWVILEPVDAAGRPVPAGQPSDSVLLTNLANRVQPLIRYELGDSVTVVPGACACGRTFPRIRVDGRRDEILRFAGAGQREIAIPPLALATAVEEGSGSHHFQAIQCGPRRMRLVVEGGTRDSRSAAKAALLRYLRDQGLEGITIVLEAGPVAANPVSGKFRQVYREG